MLRHLVVKFVRYQTKGFKDKSRHISNGKQMEDIEAKAQAVMKAMNDSLIQANEALRRLKELNKEELVALMMKQHNQKNEASKKYYEKNKEAINEARKKKYAEKKKALSSDEKTEDTVLPVEPVKKAKVPRIGKKKPKTEGEFIEEVKKL